MTVTATRARSRSTTAQRLAYAVAGAATLVASIAIAAHGDARAVTAVVVLAVAPDLPLLFGFTPGLAKGRLHPRAVPAYNATHRLIGPLAVLAVAAATGSITATAAGLAWLTHILIDRACGYGLRAADGWQR